MYFVLRLFVFGIIYSNIYKLNVEGSKLRAAEEDEFLYRVFPVGFKWGFATASYQIEGGWNSDGKGENIWDNYTHTIPSPIDDGSTGDVACDSYHKYKEDVQLLKNIGSNFYRFSISWSRIFPTGKNDKINEAGILYYNNLIDELIANGIEPVVTLYHWDLPQPLEDIGGFLNDDFSSYFIDFAHLAFERFGDRVKSWITFNEPWVICWQGYGNGGKAPGYIQPAENPYICGHNLLKAHALAYVRYDREFRESQNGIIGITLDGIWHEPATDSANDKAAAERATQFHYGWFAGPLYTGKYPQVMRELVDQKSQEEGRETSRLPDFDIGWSFLLKGSYDFLGLNHYTTNLVNASSTPGEPGWLGDQETFKFQDPTWPESNSVWLRVVPWGFRKMLGWIKTSYGNPNVLITENGFSDDDSVGTNDTKRTEYFRSYINEMLKAVLLDGCNVTSYTAWSYLDNFEWKRGYTERFGVHYVDFADDSRPRTPKDSAKVLKQIFSDNGFPDPSVQSTTPPNDNAGVRVQGHLTIMMTGLLTWFFERNFRI